MRIVAFKCPTTKNIFETEKEYLNHRRRLLIAKNHEKIIIEKKKKLHNDLNHLRETATDQLCIAKWLIDNGHRLAFVQNCEPTSNFKFIDVNINVRWNEKCSNTHKSPIGGITNWGSNKALPNGYPGFCGRIKLKYSGNYQAFFSDMFRGTCINLGSGGGSNNIHQFELILFADDWPVQPRFKIGYSQYSGLSTRSRISNQYDVAISSVECDFDLHRDL